VRNPIQLACPRRAVASAGRSFWHVIGMGGLKSTFTPPAAFSGGASRRQALATGSNDHRGVSGGLEPGQMDMPTRTLRQPVPDQRGLVRDAVVLDHMHIQPCRDPRLDLIEELAELHGAMGGGRPVARRSLLP
jgi:hypothetical protein